MEFRNNCPSCLSPDFKINGPKGNKVTDVLGSAEITQEAYHIYKCSNCGLYFRSPILDDRELELHYSNYNYKTLHNSALFPTERAVYKYLKGQHVENRQKSVLDFGCNEGVFLGLFVNDFKCYGCEIDQRVRKLAEERGIVMLEDPDVKKSNHKFDYILLIDVFEHLKNPTETISQLLDALNKSGKLIISTGYADSPSCKNDLANYWYFTNSLQHLCMIGYDYIQYIRKKFKLKLIMRKRLSHYDFEISKRDKAFYYIRYKTYLIYRFLNKIRGFDSIVQHIPVLNKPLRWKVAPYYPNIHIPTIQRDHVVLIFEKP